MSMPRDTFRNEYRAALQRAGIARSDHAIDARYDSFLAIEKLFGEECNVEATGDTAGKVSVTFGPKHPKT
jgi:hypothetical protein